MTGSSDGVEHFNNTDPVLLSEAVHDVLGINYEEFKALIKIGAIYVNNHRQSKDKWILETNSVFRVHTKPRRFSCDYDWKSRVVFQNESFLVLNKPSGLPSHPAVDNALENALTQTSLVLQVPLYVTHRLDTLTSGLIVYGKKKQFVKDFNIQMLERKVQKKYVAIIEGSQNFPKHLTHYMDTSPGTPKRLSAEPREDWEICKLEILDQNEVSPGKRWVKINLLTGRTHQIRSQMSFLGAPILGDKLYGAKTEYQKNAIALRSYQIEFVFEGKPVKFALEETFIL
tara:strand:- start:20320 stop:21174 length:855 start_codon:yes stop_codon:yes gene_type:complete